MKIISIPAVAILLLLAAAPATGLEARAAKDTPGRIERISAGLLAHDVDGLWSNSRKERGIDLNIEVVLKHPKYPLPVGTLLTNLGMSINDRGGASKVYAGVLWEVGAPSKVFFNLGIGIAAHNGETKGGGRTEKALGSRILFRVPLEFGYAPNTLDRISILFDHISNGYLREPNQGLDTLGLRYSRLF